MSEQCIFWTHVKSSSSEGRRHCSSFLSSKFDFQCDLWQYVEHYTLQQAHITVLLIMPYWSYKMCSTWVLPSELLLFSVSEQQAMHGLLQWITFNMQPILNIFKWIKSNTFCNINSYFFNRTICDKEDLMTFCLIFMLSWHKQQMM